MVMTRLKVKVCIVRDFPPAPGPSRLTVGKAFWKWMLGRKLLKWRLDVPSIWRPPTRGAADKTLKGKLVT